MGDLLAGYVPIPGTGGFGFMVPAEADHPATIRQTIEELWPPERPSKQYVFVPSSLVPQGAAGIIGDIAGHYAGELGLPATPAVSFFVTAPKDISPPWLEVVEPAERPRYYFRERPILGFIATSHPDRIFLNLDSTSHLLETIAHETSHLAGYDEPQAQAFGERAREFIEEANPMRGKPEGFATKDTITERCILPSHSEFPGTNCVVCGVAVPRLPWTSAQYAQHGRKHEAPVWDGIEPTPDPADLAVPKTELEAAEAAEVAANAAYEAAKADLMAIERVLGNLTAFYGAGAGHTIGPDRNEAKVEAAKRMRPQALEAAEAASEALLAARLEVQRLSRIREANRRQWHADQQEALAAASAAKAAATRSAPFRSFVERLGR